MVRLNRIYTRNGDDGSTGLVDGSRVSKASHRPVVMGSVDEANAAIGLARLSASAATDAILSRIQNDLFDLGADVATPDGVEGALRIVPVQVDWLETQIDAANDTLEPLKSFILPAGTPSATHLHLARTIVRRAERDAVAAGDEISAPARHYLNRLSDLLFVLARVENAATGDVLWVPGANR
ncbi:cob(I)yrinic acid a,c-diamide adenosyltransferase [Sandarakinorhabdus limnophila]|uniref:cob(I)yrinic acid a,c-diamide adenosyltransferase n=1 Tax=Sandarakinorhabdus limnophila TaxID=210512 RepID=UPI0026F014E0|nr:cob(I)yrinic acid a,c-diamide adenosyltransferase [Sandarakinorhabdus limnophila]MCM0031778.1 cob(I)yrinic acid a,c-diamide adenosyltransferase [Sandarakinorhabdus limnophila]